MDWFDLIKQTRVKNMEGLIRELYKVTADPNAHMKITGQLTEDKLNAAIAAAKQKPNQVPLPEQSPPPPPPPKKKLPSQQPPKLPAGVNNVATTQSTPLPANIQQQQQTPPPPPPPQRRTLQGYKKPQQPANAQQKKKLSDRVKATLQRRKEAKNIKRQGKNQAIVDRTRQEMMRMMTPEQKREYQLEEARKNPNKPVTQG